MKSFGYKGFEVRDSILGGNTARDAAKLKGIKLIKLREEELKLPYMDAHVYVTKYYYISKKVGMAFVYEITENYGFGEFGTYMLVSKGDFADFNDLYASYMEYYKELEEESK